MNGILQLQLFVVTLLEERLPADEVLANRSRFPREIRTLKWGKRIRMTDRLEQFARLDLNRFNDPNHLSIFRLPMDRTERGKVVRRPNQREAQRRRKVERRLVACIPVSGDKTVSVEPVSISCYQLWSRGAIFAKLLRSMEN